MKKIYIIVLIVVAFAGCENNFEDTGIANGDHGCSMWEYMQKDRANWDSAIVAIRHAGLVDVFDGTNPAYGEITFFGFTNFSVSRFLNENPQYGMITDIPADVCKRMVLSHVIKGKRLQDTFDYEIKGTLEGGTEIENINGDMLRIYRIKGEYNGTPDIGAEKLGIQSKKYGHIATVASCNIRTTNGIVHSLRSTYVWTEL